MQQEKCKFRGHSLSIVCKLESVECWTKSPLLFRALILSLKHVAPALVRSVINLRKSHFLAVVKNAFSC